MLFYKYQKSANLEFNMLRRGEVYFASPGELNDASECRPRFILKGSEELWQRLAQFVLEHVCFCSRYVQRRKEEIQQILDLSNAVGHQLKKIAGNRDFGIESLNPAFFKAMQFCGTGKLQPDLLRATEDSARNFIEQGLPRLLLDEKYIASFALNATNPTMWGHYADAEKGFVRVFETGDGKVQVLSDHNILHGTRPSKMGNMDVTEIGIYKDEHLELKTVKYGKKLPKVNAFHRLIHQFSYTKQEDRYDVPLNLGGDAEEKKEHLIGLVKDSGWRYEKEIRAFFPGHGSLLPDARILRISLENVKGIIFGPKMSLENKARAVLCCYLMKTARRSEINTEHEFSFFEAQQALDEFDFAIRPVGILAGSYFSDSCFGQSLPLKQLRELDEATAARLHLAADMMAGRKQQQYPY